MVANRFDDPLGGAGSGLIGNRDGGGAGYRGLQTSGGVALFPMVVR